jgi:hypothetical protein
MKLRSGFRTLTYRSARADTARLVEIVKQSLNHRCSFGARSRLASPATRGVTSGVLLAVVLGGALRAAAQVAPAAQTSTPAQADQSHPTAAPVPFGIDPWVWVGFTAIAVLALAGVGGWLVVEMRRSRHRLDELQSSVDDQQDIGRFEQLHKETRKKTKEAIERMADRINEDMQKGIGAAVSPPMRESASAVAQLRSEVSSHAEGVKTTVKEVAVSLNNAFGSSLSEADRRQMSRHDELYKTVKRIWEAVEQKRVPPEHLAKLIQEADLLFGLLGQRGDWAGPLRKSTEPVREFLSDQLGWAQADGAAQAEPREIAAAFDPAGAPQARGWVKPGEPGPGSATQADETIAPAVRLKPLQTINDLRAVVRRFAQGGVELPEPGPGPLWPEELGWWSFAVGLVLDQEAALAPRHRAGQLARSAAQWRAWLVGSLKKLWEPLPPIATPPGPQAVPGAAPAPSRPSAAAITPRRIVIGYSDGEDNQEELQPGAWCPALQLALPHLVLMRIIRLKAMEWWESAGIDTFRQAGADADEIAVLAASIEALSQRWWRAFADVDPGRPEAEQESALIARRVSVIISLAELLLDARAKILRRRVHAAVLGPGDFACWTQLLDAVQLDLKRIGRQISPDSLLLSNGVLRAPPVVHDWRVPEVPSGAGLDGKATARPTPRWLRPPLLRLDGQHTRYCSLQSAEAVVPKPEGSPWRLPLVKLAWLSDGAWSPESRQSLDTILQAATELAKAARDAENGDGSDEHELRNRVIEKYWHPAYDLAAARLGLGSAGAGPAALSPAGLEWLASVDHLLRPLGLECAAHASLTDDRMYEESKPGSAVQWRPPLIDAGTQQCVCAGLRPAPRDAAVAAVGSDGAAAG